MSDIRSYSSIAERTAPTQLAAQLNEHRAAMNDAILGEGGTVMQFVGDAVMAVFGAPFPQADHADRAVAAALAMHRAQHELNRAWEGTAAGGVPARHRPVDRQGGRRAARLGGAPRVHARRRHREPGPAPAGDGAARRPDHPQRGDLGAASPTRPTATPNPPELVKGRATPVTTYRIERETWSAT